jgi:hypothetical protein
MVASDEAEHDHGRDARHQPDGGDYLEQVDHLARPSGVLSSSSTTGQSRQPAVERTASARPLPKTGLLTSHAAMRSYRAQQADAAAKGRQVSHNGLLLLKPRAGCGSIAL